MRFISVYGYIQNKVDYLRTKFYTFREKQRVSEVGSDLRINGPTSLTPYVKLGDNVNMNGMEVRGDGTLKIGNNFHSGPRCVVLTRTHDFDSGDAIPYDDTYNREAVTIEDNVWLGIGVYVLPGVTIGEGAIIQAGSVVVEDIPPCAIAGGHPAEVFDYRDEEHYQELKEAGKFH